MTTKSTGAVLKGALSAPRGLAFTHWLALLFVVAKLADVIDWPWWLVLLPWYGGIIVGVVIIGILSAITVWAEQRGAR